jgi:hypothetical protein
MYLPRDWQMALLCVAMSLTAKPAVAFNITIDYTFDLPANGGNNFFGSGNPQGLTGGNQAKAALEAAASYYNTILTDTFDPIVVPSPYHSNASGSNGTISWSWQASFPNPSNNMASQVVVPNLNVVSDQYIVYAGGRTLSANRAGEGGFGGFSTASTTLTGLNSFTPTDLINIPAITASFNQAITTRGELGGFSKWGGVIAFDNDGSTSWFFNHLGTPSGNVTDFYSVAIHELSHAIGFGVSSEWQSPTLIPAGTSSFVGANAMAQNGGNPVPLDITIGSPQLAHWIAGKMSVVYGTSTQQEAVMDPDLQNGTRKKLTALDAAGLQDIGWSFGPAPAVNGDYNNNGSVDAGDYVLWRRFLTRNVFMPNRTASGTVTGADYSVWRTNFAKLAPGTATSVLDAGGTVPEPASCLLALIGAVFICSNRRLLRR